MTLVQFDSTIAQPSGELPLLWVWMQAIYKNKLRKIGLTAW